MLSRIPPFRRLNVKITVLLGMSFLLIATVFLLILLPFQRTQVARFIDDRRELLKVLVEARRGELVNCWFHESAQALWLTFETLFLRETEIVQATLFYRESADGPTERVAATSDPDRVFRERTRAEEMGLRFERHVEADGDPGRPLLVALGGEVWVRRATGEGFRAVHDGFVSERETSDIVRVGVNPTHEDRVVAGRRLLEYRALVYAGESEGETHTPVGHLILYSDLSELVSQESSTYALFAGLIAALFLVLLGLLNLSLRGSVVDPIIKVLDAMRRAGGGDLAVRLEKRSADEIGVMSDSFNEMVQALRRSQDKIEEHSRTLEAKVAERTEELRQSEKVALELKDHLVTILAQVQAGVMALDPTGRIETLNARAGELLKVDARQAIGRTAGEFLGNVEYGSLLEAIDSEMIDAASVVREVVVGPVGHLRTFRVGVASLGTGGGKVVVMDDVTDLIYSKKLMAWREAVERVMHDIKNPLTPVRLNAQQMRVAYKDRSPQLEHIVDRATANILSGVEIVERFLADFSQLYRRRRIDPAPVRMNELLDSILEEHAPADQDGVRLSSDFASDLPEVMGDKLSLRRLFTNLVQNGIEAMTERKGRLTVSTALDGPGTVRVQVQDEGSGIPPEQIDRLFDPYYTTKIHGTGLGLVIARQIVEDHRGTIEVKSRVGEGTTVTVSLPIGT